MAAEAQHFSKRCYAHGWDEYWSMEATLSLFIRSSIPILYGKGTYENAVDSLANNAA